jgi:aspartate/methionine/tyrosine aminotransferase
MKFEDFSALRARLLLTRSDVIDCGETNAYRALAALAVPPTVAPSAKIHRCHLAAEWTAHFGLDASCTTRALISCGIRDSLTRLSAHYASVAATLWLPEDNYPAYGEIAARAGLTIRTFATLPEPCWPGGEPHAEPELILVTNPLKPRARFLSDDDAVALSAWLAASPARRLVIDAVYTFGSRFDASTQRLMASDQAILLHSVTKGWLHPRLVGVALVPERDLATLAPMFRASGPPQESLARARAMLSTHGSTPATIAKALSVAQQRMRNALPDLGSQLWPCDATGYLFPISARWEELLDKHRVLGVPASVFGSSRPDITILSSLTFIGDTDAPRA